MCYRWFSLLLVLLAWAPALAAEQAVEVRDDASLRAALRSAQPGSRIRIAPGRYAPGVWAANLRGTAEQPIVIEGADEKAPPLFEGGGEGWHLSDCAYVILRNIAVRGQTDNGINVDDGGTFDTPAQHITLERVRVADVGPQGNHDAIKLSGVDDFVVRECTVEGWGGQAVDMVGCHRGLIEGCTFRGKPGFSQDAGPQTKGGSRDIAIRRCLFDDAGARAVNLGGSTGLQVFRPQGALYEAKDITVEGCTFVGSEAPIAYVGVEGAVVRYNTIYHPGKWVLRILQETTEPGFVPCANGRFERNLVVFRRADVQVFVNIGPHTRPETFKFADNLWYCEDRPAESKPVLPAAESGGVYGVDPQLAAPAEGRFQPTNAQATGFGATAWKPGAGPRETTPSSATAWGFRPSTSAAERPNIILILADDLGWADVPWHGSTYHMPHLDKLAQGGVRLEAHYVHPMCSPTRAALLTGRYASRFGVTSAQNEQALPFGTPTLAGALRAAGYETAIVGKWHLGSKPQWGPQHFGFQHSYGLLAGGCGPYDHRYKTGPYTRTWHRDGQPVEEEGHVTDLIAREAVRWLDERGGKPFFLYVAFTAIHIPIDEPEKWLQANAHLADPGARLRAATASHMDDAIGQVLEAVQRKGMGDNTLVVFLSDNGAHGLTRNDDPNYPGKHPGERVGNDNLPLRGHKGGVYEGGVRTPGVVYWPGKLEPGEVRTPLHAVDWMPTLCALAGAPPADDLQPDGMDVWPVLAEPGKSRPARAIYSAAPGFRARMVRYGDWKLVVTKPSGKKPATEELFRLTDDPGETKNLAAENPLVLSEMKRRLAEAAARDRSAP